MATQNVCGFNKYGFCRYQERCRKYHERNLCENAHCVVKECLLRHPKMCKYLRDYDYCKFGEWCYFSHKLSKKNYNMNNDEIKEMNNKLNVLNLKIKACETNITDKSKEIEALEKKLNEKETIKQQEDVVSKLDSTIEIFEGKINTMKLCLENKDDYINNLEAKLKDMESKYDVKIDTLEENLKLINSKLLKHEKKVLLKLSYLIGMSSEDEEETDMEIVKCEKCNFETTSEHGLKVHQESNHSTSLCCEICELQTKTQPELEVHVVTCEMYTCSKCEFKSKRLSQVKTHLRKKHGSGDHTFHHLKIDRNDPNKVCDTVHSLEDF